MSSMILKREKRFDAKSVHKSFQYLLELSIIHLGSLINLGPGITNRPRQGLGLGLFHELVIDSRLNKGPVE